MPGILARGVFDPRVIEAKGPLSAQIAVLDGGHSGETRPAELSALGTLSARRRKFDHSTSTSTCQLTIEG